MSKSDFNILIGVDMTNAEKTINDSIKSIGEKYKLELGIVIDSKSRFFKQIKSIQNLFKNLGKIDLDFGLGNSNEADKIKQKLKGLADVDLSSAGEELAVSMDEARRKIEQVKHAYEDLMKVTDKKPNGGFQTRTTKSGDKFANVTETKQMKDQSGALINEGKGKVISTSEVRDFEALNNYVDKAMSKIDSLSNITKARESEVTDLLQRITMLHSKLESGDDGFVGEVKAINKLISEYSNLEDSMIHANKVRETQVKEAIKWANKLAEVERQGFANPASKKKMSRLIGELDGDFKTLDNLQKKLIEIQNQFAKIQGQEKSISFDRRVQNEYEKAEKKVFTDGKLQGKYIKNDDSKKLLTSLNDVKEAKTVLQLENAIKRVNEQYDLMLRKQEETIKSDELNEKIKKINTSTHEWRKEIEAIKSQGFVNESEFTKIRDLMRGLSADSKTYEKDLMSIQTRIERLNTVSQKRQEKQEARDITKGRNNDKIRSMRGSVPDYILDNVKGMSDMLDFTSSKKDIAFIEDEMKRLVKLQEMIVQAGKDKKKHDEAILDYQQQSVKVSDKYNDSLNEIVHQMQRQINDVEKRNDIEQEAIHIQSQINALRQRGTEITYEESRAIQQQMLALKQLSQHQRDVETEKENRRITEQRIRDRFASNSYRATRGFTESSGQRRELQAMINNIDDMVQGLGSRVGGEFRQATEEIEREMNRLNDTSRRLRDEDQRRRSSFGGQLINALKKVPVWTSAMELFYGTMQQIQQGFQQILDLDKAMINLQKVTESSQLGLESFKTTAALIGRELGVVTTEVVKATTEFQKLGYTLQQSTILGKNSILYANVGDMSVENAGENIVSTIKGFGVEVDAQGNNIRNIVDMFNEVGNNFAISSEGIGEALKRSSSVMKEAGNSIQESVGLITSANAVIQDPKKVGNALKTIAMRLRGVSEEGDNVTELVPQLQAQFDRINKEFGLMGDNALNVMDKLDPTKFKSTFEIFQDLTKVWGKLSDIEQANLVETMGGKHQGVVVSAIINNWKDAEAAARTASNSAGSASREFEAYMDGFQYRIGKLQNALEHFWTTLVDEEAVKGLITALTSIVDLMTQTVEVFGAGNLGVGLTAILSLIGSKGLRDALFTVGKEGAKFKTIADALKGFTGWAGNLIKLLPRFLGWVGVLWGIAEAGKAIYMWATKESRERKEKLKILDDEISKLEEADNKYRKLFDENKKNDKLDRLGRLQDKGKSRSSEEEQEFINLTQEIKDQFPELIAYYDEYHRAVAKSADEIRRLREENEKTNLDKDIQQQSLKMEDVNFKDANKSLKDYTSMKKQIEGTFNEEQITGVMKEYIKNEMEVIDKTNYFDVLQGFGKKLNDEYAKLSKDQQDNVNELMMRMRSVVPMSKDKNEMLETLDLFTSQSKEKREYYEKEQERLKATVSTSMEEFNKLFDTAFSIETRKRGIDSNTNKFKFIDDLRKDMLANIQDFGTDSKAIINNVPKYINDAIAKVEKDGLNFDKLLTMNPESAEQTISQINAIMATLDKKKPEEFALIQTLEKIRMSHEQAFLQFKNKHIVPITVEQDVIPRVDTFIDDISALDSAYRDLTESGELSLSTTMDLIGKHPELIKSMKLENGVLKLTKDSMMELAQIKEKEFKRDLQIKLDKAKEAKRLADEEIRQNLRIAQSYVQANNVKQSLVYDPQKKIDDLQRQIDEQNPSKNPNFILDTMKNSPFTNGGKQTRTISELKDELSYWEAMSKVKTSQEDSERATENIDALEKLLAQDWSSQLGNITGGKKDKKDIQDGYYVLDQYAESIRYLNTQIEEQQRLQAQNSQWSNAYRNALNEEIYLTNMKKEAIDGEIASLQKQIETKNIQKKGLVTIDANGNENKTARLIQAELEQEIQQARERLSDLESESTQAITRADELSFNMLKSKLELSNINREMLTDDIAYQEYAMGLYDQTLQSFRDHAQEKINLLQEQMKFHKEELALLEEERSSNASLNDAQIGELNALIRAKREAVLDMAKTIQDVKTLIASSGLEEYLYKINSESEKYQKEIEKIQNNIKYNVDDEKMNEYDNHISYLQEIASLYKGQFADAQSTVTYLKEQLELYKDNKDMVEKITGEIKTWEEKMYDTENAIKDVSFEIKDIYEKLADEYVDLYKEQLELMSEAEAKRYEDLIEAQQKAHEKRMKQIEKESNALQEAYDKQMELIDRAEAKRTHDNSLDKLQKEANELKKQIDLLSMDDSYEAKSKRSDLNKQLSEKETQIMELQHDREIQLRKDNLKDDLDSEKEKLDKKKEGMEDENEKIIDSLQKAAEAREKYWEDELKNERKFAELRKQVLDGNFNEMLTNVQTWSTGVQSEMGMLGETITTNFTDKVKEAIDAITELKDAKNLGSFNSVTQVESKNMDGESKPTANVPTDNELNATDKEKSIIWKMYKNSQAWNDITGTSDDDIKKKEKLAKENQEWGKEVGATFDPSGDWFKDGKRLYSLIGMKTGGFTGDWSGDEGKLALLHKKELVLNEGQTKHILDTARIVEKIKAIIPSLNLLNGVPSIKTSEHVVASGASETNEYNIEVIVQGNADKKVADTVADQIVNKIKRTKGGRF